MMNQLNMKDNMKVIYNDIIPFGFATYINLFGVIFTKLPNLKLKKEVENHETIHTYQMKYMLYIFFYIWYGIEYILKFIPALFWNRGNFGPLQFAYRSISFEQEAFYNQNNLKYLEIVKPYAWLKYVFSMYKV